MFFTHVLKKEGAVEMKIALDVMGGDYSPREQVLAAVEWQKTHEEDQILMVGDPEQIQAELSPDDVKEGRLKIIPASEVITMNEHPAAALRSKKDASILVATGLVKKGEADALVSCGNTGAQMAAGILGLGRLQSIERSPLLTELPGKNPHAFLDIGANVDCSSKQLLQFAILGYAYMRAIKGIENPRVALLSNGTEEKKGNEVVQAAHQLMKEQTVFQFVGNVEGHDLLTDDCPEVVVCDGFCGNLILKALEGAMTFMGRQCYKQFGALPDSFKELDRNHRGGVPLLGIKGVSVVCHGSSKQQAVMQALQVAKNCVNQHLVELQQEILQKVTLD